MRRENRDYLDRIIHDPKIMVGKPVVKGTRIPVERVLAHLEKNDRAGLFAAFPELTEEDVKACLAYARAAVKRQRRAAAATSHPQRRPITKDDPLSKLIGIGHSEGPGDVSENKHKYLAEDYLKHHMTL